VPWHGLLPVVDRAFLPVSSLHSQSDNSARKGQIYSNCREILALTGRGPDQKRLNNARQMLFQETLDAISPRVKSAGGRLWTMVSLVEMP
jgi:hypothetical protein